MFTWSQSVPSPSQSLCHALSSGIKHNVFCRSDFSHLRSLSVAGPGCPVSLVVEGSIRGLSPYPIQWVEPQGWGHLRANLGFGVFWFIPPIPVVVYLPPTSFIGRIFFGLSGVGVVLFQAEQSALGWPLEGIRVWKLSRTFPGEKSPSLSLPRKGVVFHTQAHTALACNTQHPSGDGILYEGHMNLFIPTCPVITAASFPKN